MKGSKHLHTSSRLYSNFSFYRVPACVASDSARLRRERWDNSKKRKRNDGGGGGERRFPLLPSPPLPFFIASAPTFAL